MPDDFIGDPFVMRLITPVNPLLNGKKPGTMQVTADDNDEIHLEAARSFTRGNGFYDIRVDSTRSACKGR